MLGTTTTCGSAARRASSADESSIRSTVVATERSKADHRRALSLAWARASCRRMPDTNPGPPVVMSAARWRSLSLSRSCRSTMVGPRSGRPSQSKMVARLNQTVS